MIKLYTDGSGKNGIGGDHTWGFGFVVLHRKRVIATGLGGYEVGTNNIAELSGIIEGCNWLLHHGYKRAKILVVSDSKYAIQCLSTWRWSWEETNFMRGGNPMTNRDLIMRGCKVLDEFRYYPDFRWVRGHNGNRYNEVCDRLASLARKTQLPGIVAYRL